MLVRCKHKHISQEKADLSVAVCEMDLQMAEALRTAGGNQQHSAGAEVELWRCSRTSQEVLRLQLFHSLQPPAGQLNQGPLGEVR